MKVGSLPGRARKTMLNRILVPLALVIGSVVTGLIAVELAFHLLMSPTNAAANMVEGYQRVVFLDGPGTIFADHGDIFTFLPDAEIRDALGFFDGQDFRIQYDYRFHTKHLGLVHDDDVALQRASLLLLGDSFTQGQGAEPWFRTLAPQLAQSNLQIVNGGLGGTGFIQWAALDRYLAQKGLKIQKVAVIFISDDYHRRMSNFSPQELDCLSSLERCEVDSSFYYHMPPAEAQPQWLARIRASREKRLPRLRIAARVASLLPASYQVYRYFHYHDEEAEKGSKAAIAALIGKYGRDNILFIHLPQKDEVKGPSDLGLRARRAIAEAGGMLADGFKLCGLTPADYYRHDDHPTAAGYAKIAACVAGALTEVAAAH